MSKARSWIMMMRVLKQIGRDHRTFGMMIGMPMVIMLIFGFALSGEITNIPILVENADEGYEGHYGPTMVKNFTVGLNLTETLKNDERVQYHEGNYIAGIQEVENSEVYASILLPANLSECVYLRSIGQNVSLRIEIYIDGTKPALRANILAAIEEALRDSLGSQGIEVVETFAFGGAEFSGLDVSIPMVIAFVLTFLVMLLSLIIIMRERISGTQQRLYGTPLTAFERLVGYSGALLTIGMLMAAVVLGIGILVFGATVRGNIWLLIGTAMLYALTHVLFSVFLSNFAKNELQAIQMAPLISLPSMALSGMLVPVASLPVYIQPVAKILPMYYGNRLMEGIMLKGYGIAELFPDYLIILFMAVIFFILAVLTVKDRMDD